jgi:hypothetical protein
MGDELVSSDADVGGALLDSQQIPKPRIQRDL